MTSNQIANFWSKVDTAGPNDCWNWIAFRERDGRGTFRVGEKKQKAPRVAFYLQAGIDPGAQCVLHSCDNPSCVNINHLRLGTPKENTADMLTRGRHYTHGKTHRPETIEKMRAASLKRTRAQSGRFTSEGSNTNDL